ncbi:hypothetical protein NEPAR06_0517 [Nematocida parisii]|uniref:Uncharacterized protein n=1 Tax=Nematocida parisii (strain ERTm3) TaxID=935791 RepID=I3EJD6_NEMP3|nr:uncharacterized protein NEPG_01134 [Nematocida parisii ERTm1]EIJ89333.1 hypothetical protein NEQG_00103 [Nematocida parisii ERTm3]KAI5142565.1 hypothetical protein NEPAR07_0170 [Nematocida parisii]EIJ94466.1 hypothetical protein NEPG_01134 [Nematocida parisii ERTm1]KAI5153517.1 hypothetical protein NEPAR06_0517 [Nematocida parisii]KAI5156940.1 hypothetical protein NEPAR05_0923 [Nematocida parisii]|eukprot:XP_013058962.1 hypothetical protein NEPG_01134 [Nematocida parisii ERTm1]
MNIDKKQNEKVSKNMHKEVNQPEIPTNEPETSNNPTSSSELPLEIRHKPSLPKETIQKQELNEKSELPKMEISSDKTINTKNNENFLFNQEIPEDPSLKDLEDFFSNLDCSNGSVKEFLNSAHDVINEVMYDRLSPITEEEERAPEEEAEDKEQEEVRVDGVEAVITPEEDMEGVRVAEDMEGVRLDEAAEERRLDEACISKGTATDSVIITPEEAVSHAVDQSGIHSNTVNTVSHAVDQSGIHAVDQSVSDNMSSTGVSSHTASNSSTVTNIVYDMANTGISSHTVDPVVDGVSGGVSGGTVDPVVDVVSGDPVVDGSFPVVELVTEEELANMPELITQKVKSNKSVVISDIVEEFIIIKQEEETEPEPEVSKTFKTISIILLIIFIIIGTIILLNPNNIVHN